jgi:acyl-CoA synthetase (AMP-forming)/AMP-acid ligase II
MERAVAEQYNDFESFPNLVTMFLTRAAQRGDRPFLGFKHGSEWRTISWAETARRVAGLAKSLKAMGLKKGDRVMVHRRSGYHGGRLRDGANLHYQYRTRSSAYFGQ